MDWTQLTALVVAGSAAFGSALAGPISNALRRPGIEKAIEKGVAINAQPLVAKDDEQEREIAALKLTVAHNEKRIAFLEAAILSWRPRAPEPPPLTPPAAAETPA